MQEFSEISSTSSSREPVAPAARGYAYGSHRRSAAVAAEEQEAEEDGWADEARASFREREGRRSLVDGNARTCGQDGLVTIATMLHVKTSKDAVRAATLPSAGDTPIGVIKAYAADTLGISMRSLKDHSVLGYSPWERPGGAAHQLLLLVEGLLYVELIITMPKTVPAVMAKAGHRGSNPTSILSLRLPSDQLHSTRTCAGLPSRRRIRRQLSPVLRWAVLLRSHQGQLRRRKAAHSERPRVAWQATAAACTRNVGFALPSRFQGPGGQRVALRVAVRGGRLEWS